MSMQNVDMKTEWETGDNNKVVSLFQFLKELNKLKQKSILNVDKQIWYSETFSLHFLALRSIFFFSSGVTLMLIPRFLCLFVI